MQLWQIKDKETKNLKDIQVKGPHQLLIGMACIYTVYLISSQSHYQRKRADLPSKPNSGELLWLQQSLSLDLKLIEQNFPLSLI